MTGIISSVFQTVLQNAGMQATNATSNYVGHVIRRHSSKIAYHGVKNAVINPATTNAVSQLSLQAVKQSQVTAAGVLLAREIAEHAVKEAAKQLAKARA